MPGGRLASINVSAGGVPKTAVAEAAITEAGVAGDRQRDLLHHGGPDRAVSLYSLEAIEALRREGHPIGAGTAGENLTLAGLDWGAVVPGAEVRVGPVRLRITAYASPCSNIAGSFAGGRSARISQKLHPGWSRVYARVLAGGLVRVDDPAELGASPG
ncbi:MAG TPA: MOSC domain-containing protein [Anaeromyxobacteraceae bacterium]|nr:MOSC domain-containing protein [Anaeromyxobacteraceae bacterium]